MISRSLLLAILAGSMVSFTTNASLNESVQSNRAESLQTGGYILMHDLAVENVALEDGVEPVAEAVVLPQGIHFFVTEGVQDQDNGQRYVQVELETGYKFWTNFESFSNAAYIPVAQFAGDTGGGKVWWKPGWRSLGGRKARCHQGYDIAYPTGSTIAARNGSGKVVQSGWVSGYGNCVTIHHGNGMLSRYGHLSSISVRVGQHVSQGETIGRSGCTGRCSGPHLHYEHRQIGKSVCGGKKW